MRVLIVLLSSVCSSKTSKSKWSLGIASRISQLLSSGLLTISPRISTPLEAFFLMLSNKYVVFSLVDVMLFKLYKIELMLIYQRFLCLSLIKDLSSAPIWSRFLDTPYIEKFLVARLEKTLRA